MLGGSDRACTTAPLTPRLRRPVPPASRWMSPTTGAPLRRPRRGPTRSSPPSTIRTTSARLPARWSSALPCSCGMRPTINGRLAGSVQVLLPESTVLNGGAHVSGDLLVPRHADRSAERPPAYGGTLDGGGSASPSNYTVTLNGGAVAAPRRAADRRRRVPDGRRASLADRLAQRRAEFAAVRAPATSRRFATSSSTAMRVRSPCLPGTYGMLIANGNSGFVLGVPGATEPAVYNLQGLVVNGASTLQVVGPVILNVASGVIAERHGRRVRPNPARLAAAEHLVRGLHSERPRHLQRLRGRAGRHRHHQQHAQRRRGVGSADHQRRRGGEHGRILKRPGLRLQPEELRRLTETPPEGGSHEIGLRMSRSAAVQRLHQRRVNHARPESLQWAYSPAGVGAGVVRGGMLSVDGGPHGAGGELLDDARARRGAVLRRRHAGHPRRRST